MCCKPLETGQICSQNRRKVPVSSGSGAAVHNQPLVSVLSLFLSPLSVKTHILSWVEAGLKKNKAVIKAH